MRNNLNQCHDQTTREIERVRHLLKVYPNHSQLKADLKRLNRLASHIAAAIEYLPTDSKPSPDFLSVLKRFGASLTSAGFIVNPKGKETAVRALQQENRVLFHDHKGVKIGSIQDSPHLMEQFIKNNWNWKKTV